MNKPVRRFTTIIGFVIVFLIAPSLRAEPYCSISHGETGSVVAYRAWWNVTIMERFPWAPQAQYEIGYAVFYPGEPSRYVPYGRVSVAPFNNAHLTINGSDVHGGGGVHAEPLRISVSIRPANNPNLIIAACDWVRGG